MFDTPTILLYHGTSAVYEHVEPAMLGADPEAAPNCVLGLWLTTEERVAGTFGSRVVTFEVPTDGVATITSRELWDMHIESLMDEDGGYDRHRAYAAALREDGKCLLLVVSKDGSWELAVALDPVRARVIEVKHSPLSDDDTPAGPRAGR